MRGIKCYSWLFVLAMVALAAVCLFAPVAFAQTVTYSYSKAVHGGGTIQVTHDLSETLVAFQIATDLGGLEGTVTIGSGQETYVVNLRGTTEVISMTLVDGGQGTLLGTIDYGPGGTISFVHDETAQAPRSG